MRRAALAIAVVLAVAPSAHADKAKAEQYFRAGAQAFKQQSYGAAAEQFELAYKELPLPEIAFSAAQAYRRQYFIEPKPEYVKRAVELYRAYLDAVKTGGRVGDASDGLAEMQRELEHLTAKGTRIEVSHATATRLAVSVSVAGAKQTAMTELSAMPASEDTGAKATLDGKPVEMFVPIDVAPGEHQIAVEAPGYVSVNERRRVVEGATELVEVELKPKPARVTIHVDAGAQIAIDGRPVGDAPVPAQELAPGHHVVAITARGREAVVHEIELERAEAKTLDVHLVQTGKRRAVPWLFGIAAGLAVLSGASAAYAVVSDGKMANLEHTRETTGITPSQLLDYRTWVQRRDDSREAAWILGGAAVATAGIAAALYWFDVPRPTERTAVVPAASPGGASLTLVGSF
jgi:hypothetical protein